MLFFELQCEIAQAIKMFFPFMMGLNSTWRRIQSRRFSSKSKGTRGLLWSTCLRGISRSIYYEKYPNLDMKCLLRWWLPLNVPLGSSLEARGGGWASPLLKTFYKLVSHKSKEYIILTTITSSWVRDGLLAESQQNSNWEASAKHPAVSTFSPQ